jgi:hypothetical protein
MRVRAAVAAHVAQAARPTGNASARRVPRKVATPLPPLKRSQMVAEKCGKGGELGGVFTHRIAGDQNGDTTLGGIEDKGGCGGGFVAGAQDVGCADVAGADVTQVTKAHGAGDDDAKGDGAEEVGGDCCNDQGGGG